MRLFFLSSFLLFALSFVFPKNVYANNQSLIDLTKGVKIVYTNESQRPRKTGSLTVLEQSQGLPKNRLETV